MKKSIFTLLFVAIGGMTMFAAQPKIWLLGDGIMAGWGKAFAEQVGATVEVKNIAQEGLSMKVLDEMGGLDSVIVDKTKKDFLLVQLGQNDLNETNLEAYCSLDDFTQKLVALVHAAEKKKMMVILCTPLAHPYYKEGVLIDRLGGYAEAVRRVAISLDVPLIDLEASSHEWIAGLGEEGVQAYYNDLNTEERPAGEYLLNDSGAQEIARMALDGMLMVGGSKITKLLAK